VVTLIPMLSQVNVIVGNLRRLEATLDQGLAKSAEYEDAPLVDLSSFEAIRLNGVCFTYKDSDGNATFQVGPVDAEIRRGEILFLVGATAAVKRPYSNSSLLCIGRHKDYLCRQRGDCCGQHSVLPQSFSAIFSDFTSSRNCTG